jgi:hypothetical protein
LSEGSRRSIASLPAREKLTQAKEGTLCILGDRYCHLRVGSSKPRAHDKWLKHITIKNVAKLAGGKPPLK